MECFVNFISCLDEEREIVREVAAMGFDWDRKMKVLKSAVVVVVMSEKRRWAHFGNTRNSYITPYDTDNVNHDPHILPHNDPPRFVARFLPSEAEPMNLAQVAAGHEQFQAATVEYPPYQVVRQVHPNASCASAEHIAHEMKLTVLMHSLRRMAVISYYIS